MPSVPLASADSARGDSSPLSSKGARSRASSLPDRLDPSDDVGWTLVARKSKVVASHFDEVSSHVRPLSSDQLRDEEDTIKVAQRVLRTRSCSRPPPEAKPLSTAAKKKVKQRLHNQVL